MEEKKEEKEVLTRGGVYLARLDPVKITEVGKIRPVVVLTVQPILDIQPPIIFICPLSSQSHLKLQNLHIKIPARDSLEVPSYALVEHCRAIAIKRLIYPRIAQLTASEIMSILNKLRRMVGI